MDLNDPDLERGKATLAAIEAVGIPRRRWQDSEPVPNPPAGWNQLLWPSQILIQVGKPREGHETKKFLVEAFTAPREWYKLVASHPTAMLMLFATNRNGPISAEALDHEMEHGSVPAVTLHGMATGPVRTPNRGDDH